MEGEMNYFKVLLLVFISLYSTSSNSQTTDFGRLDVTWTDLGFAGGAGQVAVHTDAIEKISDNINTRYNKYSGVANSAVTTITHNLGAPFAEYRVVIYTGNGISLVRVQDPVAAGWVIAAGGTPNTQIDITAPSSGGPHTFAVLIQQATFIESIDELDDVDISTTPPTTGQTLVWDGTKFEAGSGGGGGSGEINYISANSSA